MTTFTHRLESGEPLPDDVADAMYNRHARLQDLFEGVERLVGVLASGAGTDATDAARREVEQVLVDYRLADSRFEELAQEANRGSSWRTIDIRDTSAKSSE